MLGAVQNINRELIGGGLLAAAVSEQALDRYVLAAGYDRGADLASPGGKSSRQAELIALHARITCGQAGIALGIAAQNLFRRFEEAE